MDRLANEMKALYGINPRRIKDGSETIAIEFKDFGLLLTSNDRLLNNKMHCVSVDKTRLDDRIYCNSIINESFWKLIEAGYLRYMRLERFGFYKSLMLSNGWAQKIINKRLEEWGDKPKYANLVKINKIYMKELTYNFSREPCFFDFLWQ